MNGEGDFFDMHFVSDDRMKRDTSFKSKKGSKKYDSNTEKTISFKKSSSGKKLKLSKNKKH
jgi:hypothetical protein